MIGNKMKDIDEIASCLKRTPSILLELIAGIPENLLKKQRIPRKWSIHEHACHLVLVQPRLTDRFRLFIQEDEPEIKPFIPGKTDPHDDLLNLELRSTLEEFHKVRKEQLGVVAQLTQRDWAKKALHEEYIEYTPRILLRHILMHEHFHMYRIEELWLTTDTYLREAR